ncbi:MAG: hypothetical protein AAGD14_08380 [Planctomycetota bacterium]
MTRPTAKLNYFDGRRHLTRMVDARDGEIRIELQARVCVVHVLEPGGEQLRDGSFRVRDGAGTTVVHGRDVAPLNATIRPGHGLIVEAYVPGFLAGRREFEPWGEADPGPLELTLQPAGDALVRFLVETPDGKPLRSLKVRFPDSPRQHTFRSFDEPIELRDFEVGFVDLSLIQPGCSLAQHVRLRAEVGDAEPQRVVLDRLVEFSVDWATGHAVLIDREGAPASAVRAVRPGSDETHSILLLPGRYRLRGYRGSDLLRDEVVEVPDQARFRLEWAD